MKIIMQNGNIQQSGKISPLDMEKITSDAGALLQASYVPASQHIKRAFNGRREAQPSRFQILKMY
jgi:hypothetical protein